jgi:drug/metabolite transporter (DMT)-like permease
MSKDIGTSLGSVLGQLAIVLASVFYAGGGVYARKTTHDMPGIMRSAGPLLPATVLMWLTMFLVESPVKFPRLGITWIALLFLGVLGSGFAFVLSYYLLHEIGPTRTSMVTYLFPLGGVILGVAFLNEQLSWQLVLGALLIVLSLIVANLQPQKQGQNVEKQATANR